MKAFLGSRIVLFLGLLLFPALTFAAPSFSTLSVQSNNANTTLAKSGDLLTFELTLSLAEDSNGGTITFDVGGTVGLTANIPATGIASTKHFATYAVLAGQNGAVQITNITFANTIPQNITNLPAFPHTPGTNVLVDTTPPTVGEVTPIPTPTNNVNPSYTFSSNENGTIGYGGGCSSPSANAINGNNVIVLNALGEGTYNTCTITVTDSAGNVSNVQTISAFKIDTTAPTVSESAGIVSPTNDTTPDYVFNTNEAGSISYGGGCSSPTANAVVGNNTITLNALADGTYNACTITITDDASNASNPLTLSPFTIDTAKPVLNEITAVTTPTNDTTPNYTFSSDKAGNITYGGGCSSATVNAITGNNTITLNALAEGTYNTCTVTVTDAIGNVSNPLTISAFEIDTTAPTTNEITAVPTPTNDTTPNYTFNTNEAGSIVYGGGCTSGTANAVLGNNAITLNALAEGTYNTCTIEVTDAAGNTSNTLTLTTFEIDTTAPVITETTPVTTPTSDATPDYIFNTNEAGAITYGGNCSSGTVNALSGNNTVTFNALADGGHSNCTVRVTDAAGNISNLQNVTSFEVDTVAPNYNSISVTSNNGYDNSYAKPGSVLTFTLQLSNADVLTSGQITFDIGATTGLTANVNVDGTRKANYTATYTILAGQDGAISVTNIATTDHVGLTLQSFVSPQVPAPTVTIDTTFPTINAASVAGNGDPNHTNYLRVGKTATYSLTFSEPINTSGITAASTAQNISTLTQDIDINGNASNDTIVFTVQAGDNGLVQPQNINFTVTDRAGNQSTINSLGVIAGGPIYSDTNTPGLTTVHIQSNNVDTTRAKTNDNIIITFTSDETIENVASTIFGEVATVTNLGGNNWQAVLMTSGNEADGNVPFTIDFIDRAGNAGVQVTGTTDSSAVIFDKTNPIINSATITSSNAYVADAPTFYAKNNETITLSFTSNEAIKAPTGTILGKNATITNPSADQRNWVATITTANADPEGIVPFSINIFDLTGNGDGVSNPLVTITATTNGSSVVFDRTAPDIPTSVLDNLGAVTAKFKHRVNASYSWSGHQDLDTSDSFVGSGVYQFLVRLNNASAGYNETNTITIPNTTHNFYAQKVLPPNDNDYNFYIEVVDKAGNHSAETLVYSQKYTIGLLGQLKDENENVIPNATVQVVAAYGDTCDTGTDICSDTTDASGNYSIVLQKDRDYIVSYFEREHYLAKTTTHIPQTDVTQNITLKPITARKQHQSGSQIIQLFAQKEENNQTISSKIFINSLSGQIETESTTDGFLIRSFSRIISVTSSNTDVIIVDNGDNTFTVRNAGVVVKEGAKDDFGVATTIGDDGYSTGSSFESGDSRVGVIATPSSGKAHLSQSGRRKDEMLSHGKIWTEEESKAFTKEFNKGSKPKVNFYINRNGFKVFAGYTSGRLGVDDYEKRHQNQVFYRGKKYRKTRAPKTSVDKKSTGSLTEKNKEMKTKYQRQYKKSTKKRGRSRSGYKRPRNNEAYKTAKNKRLNDQKAVNKFAKKRISNNKASRIKGKNNAVTKLRIKGKSVSMAKIFTKSEPKQSVVKVSPKPVGTFFSEEISR